MQQHTNADIDQILAELEIDGDRVAPYVMLVWQGDNPVAMLVGRIEPIRIELKLGYLGLGAPRVRGLSFIAGCITGVEDAEVSQAVHRHLLTALASGECEVVRLFNVPLSSPFYQVARRDPGWLQRDRVVRTVAHWKIDLPESSDAFYRRMKEKHRRPLRKMCRRIEVDNDEGLGYRLYTRPEDVPVYCSHAEAITARSYLRAIGAGFSDTPVLRRRLALAAERGQWHALVLFVQDRPCAFWSGTLYGGTFHAEHTGRDPAVDGLNPGTGMITFAKLLEHLCDAVHARELDFGIGDYAYKQRFGTRNQDEATILVFAPCLKPIAINVARTVLAGMESTSRHVLERLGLRDRLKQLWRKQLAASRGDR